MKKFEEELQAVQKQKEQYIVAEKFDEALKFKNQEDDLLKKLDDLKKEETE